MRAVAENPRVAGLMMGTWFLGTGFASLALAALVLSFGRRVLELEFRVAWVIVAGLAAVAALLGWRVHVIVGGELKRL